VRSTFSREGGCGNPIKFTGNNIRVTNHLEDWALVRISFNTQRCASALCTDRREAQSAHETPPYPSRCGKAFCGSGQLCYWHSIRPVLWHPQPFGVRHSVLFHNRITGREKSCSDPRSTQTGDAQLK
jgi:hypothetical protein